ncbi:MAG: efflux RND transporter periplasmic adaptor subunit [Acidobacteriota bacterium]|nr:efflux RND transporter periplasmic adaptor subunit [Acidobacteriota bacterium]
MKKAWIGVGVAALLAVIVGFSLTGGRREKGPRVRLEAAAERDVARVVKATGEIDPRVKVNLSAHVVGKIEELFVVEGQRVSAGEPFLRLEREAFAAARDRAAAELEIARSRVRQAEVNVADARLKLARAERLAAAGIAAAADLEAAELAFRSQELAAEQAREAVLQAAASLEKAADDLRKTTIYAPLTGRVTALNAEVGEVVVSGTMNNPGSVIGTIADLSEILAEVDVDETEVAFLEIGQEASLKVDALADRELAGRVVEIGSSGFQRPGSPDVTYFKAKILLDDPDPALRPGMSVRADVVTATAEGALAVPVQAVVDRRPVDGDGEPVEGADEIEVVLVLADGEIEQRPVTTGLSDITHVQILSGLAVGERVVTGPHRILRDLDHGDPARELEAADDDDGGDGDGDEG